MDIHNNDVGVEIGKNNPNASPEQLATIIFDSKKWGERSVKNELKTRAVRYASPKTAKSFDIRYGYSKR